MPIFRPPYLSFFTQQCVNRSLRWSLPDLFRVSYLEAMLDSSEANQGSEYDREADKAAALSGPDGMILVAGVYLHLYVTHPGWSLRRPEEFLDGVLNKFIEVSWTHFTHVNTVYSFFGIITVVLS
ncbi:unnamed protein product [Protopolystoma xenopodis]|uniref:Uncharacterized protein n=1 Tax=Protopolystoma xenopodis TaxID=117903 RepID=A0A448WWI7_9PLAT|nr:unnamed protein product [Protopolystoma xenopodis]